MDRIDVHGLGVSIYGRRHIGSLASTLLHLCLPIFYFAALLMKLKHQSFIVVRPPPSKTNHPLNLQVQLVPPSHRERDNTRSSNGQPSREPSLGPEGDDGTSDIQLTRTSSNRSEVSMYSSYSSSSISSVASTSTTSSGRRMIIPLYNLQAHSVLTNTILDAGTDAKVAKFQKRGLEVIGLALLEPIEVWGDGGNPTPLPGHSPNMATGSLPDEYASRRSLDVGAGAHTPTSSALSLASEEYPHTPAPATPALAVTGPPATPSTARNNTPTAKKFFNKMFKRRPDSPVNTPSFPTSPLPPITAQPPSPAPPASPTTGTGAQRRSSLLLAGALNVPGHSPAASGSEPPPSAGLRESVFLQPPILGLQPSLSATTFPPRGRPTKYVWIVRKWLKGTPESLLSGVRDRFQSRGSFAPAPIESLVEVRFEWCRGKSGKKRRGREDRSRSKRHSLVASSAGHSTTSFDHHHEASQQDPPTTTKQKRMSLGPADARRSIDSHRSEAASASVNASDDGHARASPSTTAEDGGDESDPEDSETPWTCTLIVRRLNASRLPPSPTAEGTRSSSGSCKVKIAGVVPTPHHPKVVALLKVPFPLPDIEIERVNVRKRIVTPAGVARPAPAGDERPSTANGNGTGNSKKSFFGGKEAQGGNGGPVEGLVLTAEEIKDVVSSTALWLVVREGFGGVGRVSRKGDGAWRIR